MIAKERKKYFDYDWRLLLSYSALSFFIMMGTNNTVFTIFALILSFFIIIKNNTEELIGFLFFLLPFAGVFQFAGDFALFHLVSAGTILKILHKKKGTLPRKPFLLIILFAIYNLSFSWGTELFGLIKLCLYFLLMAMVFFDNKNLNLKKILIIYSTGIILATVYAQFNNLFPNLREVIGRIDESTIRSFTGEQFTRLTGLYNNPNFFSMDVTMALSCWICYFLKRNIKKTEYLFIIVLSILGLLSLSNSFLLAYMFLLVVAIVSILKYNFKKGVLSIAAIVMLLMVVWNILSEDTLYILLVRVERMRYAGDVAEMTTGRADLWMLYLDYTLSSIRNVFFGAGLGRVFDYAAHNYFIELLFHLGVVGGGVYLLMLGKAANIYPKFKKRELINYLPLLIFIFRGMAINLMFRDNKIFFIILIVVALNTDFNLKGSPKQRE